MIDEKWDAFVIFVNAYYAVQEAMDSARREWERPAPGLDAFCRDANPFLWDHRGSAEEELYEGFAQTFQERFEAAACTADEGFELARAWLASLEGERYGTSLVSAFDSVTDAREFSRACRPVSHQIAARASRLERTPQDEPVTLEAPAAPRPSDAQIDAVIGLLAGGDEEFERLLRARLDAAGS